ncbi:MAG: hypothetical protein A3F13_08760 [Gammaproteobacteria bacterium RIFCSPHIGHO2_12_FULL_40_19]|nr:MAG: hypothetical protein A3F13_08760 [Gammaproteobacteria bacterium RIFCSPHIGHO2_12_FULL_40_19]
MAFFSIQHIDIKGIAAAVPKKKESNWDYDQLTTAEKKLLIKYTGVESRRIATEGITTSDLCFHAAEKLIKSLNWNKEDIDILIFLSQSSDYYLPATSVILQHRLGLPKNCMAFDINLGCSGYVYGLSVISSIMSASSLKKGLLLMGDVSSVSCSKEDKSTYPLFGDAGTATALDLDNSAGKMTFQLNSAGSHHKSIIIPDGGLRNLVSKDSFTVKQVSDGIKRADINLALNGLDVFDFCITEVPKSIKAFFELNGTQEKDYDHFLMHQANKLMNETIRKKLKFKPEKVPYSIQQFGNTSSASIPLTIVTQMKEQVENNFVNLLLAGFGVGFSWGIGSLSLKNIACPELIEI